MRENEFEGGKRKEENHKSFQFIILADHHIKLSPNQRVLTAFNCHQYSKRIHKKREHILNKKHSVYTRSRFAIVLNNYKLFFFYCIIVDITCIKHKTKNEKKVTALLIGLVRAVYNWI